MPSTLFDKSWNAHVVKVAEGDQDVLYIDRHFIHEVTSPQAFDGLRKRGLPVFRPKQTIATADHNVPTRNQHLPIREELSRFQVDKLTEDCRDFAPQGGDFEQAVAHWQLLVSDPEARFDREYHFRAEDITPMLTYGTNPGMGMGITDQIPVTAEADNPVSFAKSLDYMGFAAGEQLLGKPINYVFIGSCTNSRIEDLRLVAQLIEGQQKAPNVQAMIVPGSKQVEQQAIAEGLDQVFRRAGFDFREPGCSACLGMNEDKVPAGEDIANPMAAILSAAMLLDSFQLTEAGDAIRDAVRQVLESGAGTADLQTTTTLRCSEVGELICLSIGILVNG